MRVAGRLLLVALLLVAAMPSGASAQRKRDPAPAADAGEPPQVVERDDGMSTFSTISLMVLAAGVGGMAVSLVGSRARARAAAATISWSTPGPKPEVVEAALAAPAGPTAQPARRSEGKRAGGQAAAAGPAPKPAPVSERARERPAAGPVKAAAPERKSGQVNRAPVERPAAMPAARGAPARVKVTPPDAKRTPPDRAHAAAPAQTSPAKAPRSTRAPVDPPSVGRDAVAAASEPAPAAASVDEAPTGWDACRIGLWSGYVKSQFYAESPSGERVAQSPFFRLEHGCSIEDSQLAADALGELLEELTRAGWEVAGRGPGSWDVSLRRRTGVPQPVH